MTQWTNCYDDNWNDLIVPEAFSHPAKYARGLIRRIYQHALERGYLKPGDVVVDPFGGVALGALDALANGIHWRGVELERRFHWLGAGGDCPGFTRDTCRRFYARGSRLFEKLGLCPDCQKAWEPGTHDVREDKGMFHQREIPHQQGHHFVGNLDLFRKAAVGVATAELFPKFFLTGVAGYQSLDARRRRCGRHSRRRGRGRTRLRLGRTSHGRPQQDPPCDDVLSPNHEVPLGDPGVVFAAALLITLIVAIRLW